MRALLALTLAVAACSDTDAVPLQEGRYDVQASCDPGCPPWDVFPQAANVFTMGESGVEWINTETGRRVLHFDATFDGLCLQIPAGEDEGVQRDAYEVCAIPDDMSTRAGSRIRWETCACNVGLDLAHF